MKNERILVMAHAHPDFSLGGGEIAAYNLFKAYSNNKDVEEAWYLGRADRGRGATGAISLRRPNEYLWEQSVHDWHMMKAVHQESLTTWFADLIRALKPTIVHTHHYAHMGLEYLRIIKQVDPSIRIMMTLHEYMAICSNNGQMIKTGNFKLCNRESYDECHRCFPDRTAEDFWMRKHTFMKHFALVDQFVSPSEFLRQRYIDWGLAPEKIVVIENGQADESPLPPRPLAENETRNRYGFFGQINPYKGLDVLLEALTLMPKSERKKIVLEVHGANLEHQSPEFQKKIEELRAPLIKQGVVQWIGPYQPHELRSRMAGIDWVIVPSVWWENSPMVIQEAKVCGRPLLVSNIGGMAEKVNNGIDGMTIPAGNRMEWRNMFSRQDITLAFDTIIPNIKSPLTYSQCAEKHIQLLDS
ncbi:glycosyltransferase [Leclercia adecarboxylata]|uniref:Glycosyltransferase n=1 Tax=Leclercia adecarboxylata TaxID=83655 RepID=A0ABU6IBB7_9ENTR|nr:glycosyltransferase [Leclercia adecarboxylata]MEC3904376.1 glycosyltransferase [Leclercia adecarboxylata]MEC3938881.1 glycosyltransferase [Leclercia adecarboxylata]QEY53838.1 glycosyltransferase family 4 protein [Leclercia adecarboxylata]